MKRADIVEGLKCMIGNTDMGLKYAIMNVTKRKLERERCILVGAVRMLEREAWLDVGFEAKVPNAVGNAAAVQDHDGRGWDTD